MVWWLLQGLVTSAVLAGAVWALCRWGRIAPAGRYVLWLVVLVKLLMPPVVTWHWPAEAADRGPLVAAQGAGGVSRWERVRRWLAEDDRVARTGSQGSVDGRASNSASAGGPAAESDATVTSGRVTAGHSAISITSAAEAFTLRHVLLALWLAGGAWFVGMQVLRTVRMQRLVRAGAADARLSARVEALAGRMRVRAPEVYRVADIESPCIFSVVRPCLLWPASLQLDEASSGLLAHELAHLRRRDHWVGWLELAAGCLWWWSPVYWLARRELRANAELSCDAFAVAVLPAQRRQYAEALLTVCERQTERPMPAMVVGAFSGKRQLRQRLVQIMDDQAQAPRPALTIAAAVLLLAAAIPACSMAHDPRHDLPFSISRDTTYLTSPIGPDGAPDYYAALNVHYGKGVTPENNGFVTWIEKVNGTPASDALARQQLPRLLKMCGAKALTVGALTDEEKEKIKAQIIDTNKALGGKVDPRALEADQDRMLNALAADAGLWQSYNAFLRNHKRDDPDAIARAYSAYPPRQRAPWTAADDPLVAEYLTAIAPRLAAASVAADQPQWWIPDVGESMDSLLNSLALNSVREVSLALSARAMLRAGSGDFNGMREDILTIKRLARKLGASSTGIEWLAGYGIERVADDAVASIACSGKLDANQCDTLRHWLDRLPVFPDPIHTIDIYERFDLLHLHIMAATEPPEFKKYIDLNVPFVFTETDEPDATVSGAEHPGNAVNPRAVDWDRAMHTVNQWVDAQVKMMRIEPYAARHAVAVPLDKEHNQWLREFGREPSLHPQPGEAREAYTDRVSHSLIASVEPSFEFVPMQYHELLMRTAMARSLLFIAQGKASPAIGKWPATVLPTDTMDGGKPLLPLDIYSAGGTGTQPVRYVLTPGGPRLYSVGRNGIDDGGENGLPNKDDIAVGPPPAPPASAPARP